MDFLADTTLLIDLWREQKKPGQAMNFARIHADRSVGIPWVVAGEFKSGGVLAGQDSDLFNEFLGRYIVIHSTPAIVDHYAALFTVARQKRLSIGPNDLWIAACAVAMDLPLATRNASDFESLPDIKLIDYMKV